MQMFHSILSRDNYEWMLAGGMVTTPVWSPSLSQTNEILAFIGFVMGIILTAMKIGEHMQRKKDDRKESSSD